MPRAKAHRFFRAAARASHVPLLPAGYWENLIHFGMGPQRQADGTLAMTFPTGAARIPWIGAEDIGIAAHQMFLQGEALIFDSIGLAGEHLSGAELAHAAGIRARRTRGLQLDQRRCLPRARFPGCRRARQHVAVQARLRSRVPRAPRPARGVRKLHPRIANFATWLKANANRIPVAQAA